jgi:hypothetical protein
VNANDAFRTSFKGGVLMLTGRVDAPHDDVKTVLLERVRDYNRFTRNNDPEGLHDCGAIYMGVAPETLVGIDAALAPRTSEY